MMIKPFQFSSLPHIFFKNGAVAELPVLIQQYGRKIILVTGKESFTGSERGRRLMQNLENTGLKYHHIKISGEPSPEDIDLNSTRFKGEDISCVVGIGGGSVLDAGKALSAMLCVEGTISEYLEGVGSKIHTGKKIPYFAVPTTSGTGSEATKNAVISRVGKDGFKRSLRHENFVPDIAVVDPELSLNCPQNITAASGMDCFTQLAEAFLSDKSNPMTDALALKGMEQIKSSLVRCYNDGKDLKARSGMSFAALSSGICLANAGLGVIHGFASSIGGRYDIPHGIICGTLMAPANEVIVRKLRKTAPDSPALKKYALLGDLFLDIHGKSDDYLIHGFIEYLKDLSEELHLPDLEEAGMKKEDIEEIAKITECKNNPVKLDYEELLEILKAKF